MDEGGGGGGILLSTSRCTGRVITANNHIQHQPGPYNATNNTQRLQVAERLHVRDGVIQCM